MTTQTFPTMQTVKLFTHEVAPGHEDDEDAPLAHQELELRLPEAVAERVATIFYDNPEGTTSVHEETLAQFPAIEAEADARAAAALAAPAAPGDAPA